MIIATDAAIALLLTICCAPGFAKPECDGIENEIIEIQNKITALTERQSKYLDEVQKHSDHMNDDVEWLAQKYAINRLQGSKGPCQDYYVLNDISRNINQPEGRGCDSDIIPPGSWYRFLPPAGTQLHETPPAEPSCGTQATMWLNGSHPTIENVGIVERQLCGNVRDHLCIWSITLQIVLCPGGYYVYRPPMVATPGCPMGWCAVSLPLPPPRPESFVVVASSRFQVAFASSTLGLTKNGHVLIAADIEGLLEYSTFGSIVSVWKPETKDTVSALTVLRDGRVLVITKEGITFLKRSGSAVMTAGVWTEDRRINIKLFQAECLSIDGDLLALIERRYDWQSGSLAFAMQLDIVNITTGVKHATLNREYNISSVVLTNKAVITMSYGTMLLRNGRKVFVLDAHTREGDRRLWRYQREENDGALLAICADSTGRLLYVAVQEASEQKARLTVLSISDGSVLRRFALTFDLSSGTQPWKIAMGRAGAKSVLVVLHKHQSPPTTFFVSMHPSDDY